MQIFKEEEMDRIYVLRQVKERKLTQSEAGCQLGLSERQIRRLLERMSEDISEIRSRKRGGNRAFKEEFKQHIIAIVREKYPDFGPTFASEKLEECDGLTVNRETLRQWMMEEGLWRGKMRKNAKTHQSRQRRSRFGELVQIDGSHHDWFEGRGPKCCLLVFIDDATSELICARFEKAETTLGYMRCVYEHVQTYRIPVSYYSDRHSIFKTSRNDTTTQFADTQFNRALKNLGIELICAHSPQAKGRVERANKTLQDRLVKEMHLRKISSIEEANRYLPEFIKLHNEKFAVAAQSPQTAHKPLFYKHEALRHILSVQTNRKLSKNLEFSHNCVLYQIVGQGHGYRLRHATVTVCEHMNGEIDVIYNGSSLSYKILANNKKTPTIADAKEVSVLVDHLISQQNFSVT